jgi:hypothetical protein
VVQVQVVRAHHPAGELDDEERVAARPVVHRRGQRAVAGRAELDGQQRGDVVGVQAGQPQAGGRRLPGQPGQAVGDLGRQLLADGARGDHDHDGGAGEVPGQQSEQLHRRRVGPLQVVEHHQHRRRAGRRPQPGAQVLEQPEARGVRVVVGAAGKRRELLLVELLEHLRPRPQGGGARVVRAAAPRHRPAGGPGGRGGGLGQAGLADAGLALQDDDGRATTADLVRDGLQLGELGAATDQKFAAGRQRGDR